jgi:tRNA (mo5U34)-methyltransferase
VPRTAEEIQRLKDEMSRIQWAHSIDLGPELGVTPGMWPNPLPQLSYMHMPEDLTGKFCLDVGSWDGWFAFEMERRNAAHITAIDLYWNMPGKRAGIDFAVRALGSKVVVEHRDVYHLPTLATSFFDVVCYAGVLYHLKDALSAFEAIWYSMSPGGLLITETHLDLLSVNRPACAWYSGGQCDGDPSNWLGPNVHQVLAWMEDAGFVDCEFVGGVDIDHWKDAPPDQVTYARGAFHAYKPNTTTHPCPA